MVRRACTVRGFTMLEVLLVIGLLVALMALVLPNFIGQKRQGDIGTAKLQMGNLDAALTAFYADLSRYPTTDEGLAALTDRGKIQDDELAKRWAGPYLNKSVELRDPWGSPYHYECPGHHAGNEEKYDLWSNGPDRQEGTDDDICNWESGR